jgi:hypothetical protein
MIKQRKGKERDHQEMMHQIDKQKRRAHLERIGVEFEEIDLPRQIITHSSSQLRFNTESQSMFSLDFSKARTEIGYEPPKMEKGLMKWLSL